MGDRFVPDGPVWWWRDELGKRAAVEVTGTWRGDGSLIYWSAGDEMEEAVEDDGSWLGPCRPPAKLGQHAGLDIAEALEADDATR